MSATEWVLVVFGVLGGLAVGSFTCVVIDRLPMPLEEPNEFGEEWDTRPWRDVVGGTSRCSSCGEPVRPRDEVPVLSWLVLRGRCRDCGERIPAYHPWVELSVPVLWALLVWAVGWGWAVVPALVLVPVGVAVSAIDLRTLMVPTRLVWPGLGLVVAASVLAAAFTGETGRLAGRRRSARWPWRSRSACCGGSCPGAWGSVTSAWPCCWAGPSASPAGPDRRWGRSWP